MHYARKKKIKVRFTFFFKSTTQSWKYLFHLFKSLKQVIRILWLVMFTFKYGKFYFFVHLCSVSRSWYNIHKHPGFLCNLCELREGLVLVSLVEVVQLEVLQALVQRNLTGYLKIPARACDCPRSQWQIETS